MTAGRRTCVWLHIHTLSFTSPANTRTCRVLSPRMDLVRVADRVECSRTPPAAVARVLLVIWTFSLSDFTVDRRCRRLGAEMDEDWGHEQIQWRGINSYKPYQVRRIHFYRLSCRDRPCRSPRAMSASLCFAGRNHAKIDRDLAIFRDEITIRDPGWSQHRVKVKMLSWWKSTTNYCGQDEVTKSIHMGNDLLER